MRVTLLCADRGVPLGGPKGCSVHLRSVASALLRAGHHVTASVARSGDTRDFAALERAGLEVRPLASTFGMREAGAGLRRAAPELVIERLALLAPFGALAAREQGIPHVYEANAPLDEEAGDYRGFENVTLAHQAFRAGFAASLGTIAVSEAVAGWVRGLAPERHPIRVVPNGAGPEFFETPDPSPVAARRAGLGIGQGLVVGFVGSFKPWHDLDPVIQAVAALPPVTGARLLLVGEGPTRAKVLASALARGLSPIAPGAIAHHQVPLHLALCDVVVVPYARNDVYFSPLKLVEAMAAGRPVLASATAPVEAVVRHAASGWLVPPGDADAMTHALATLAADPGLRARLGAEARREARRFTWDRAIQDVLEFARTVPAGAGS